MDISNSNEFKVYINNIFDNFIKKELEKTLDAIEHTGISRYFLNGYTIDINFPKRYFPENETTSDYMNLKIKERLLKMLILELSLLIDMNENNFIQYNTIFHHYLALKNMEKKAAQETMKNKDKQRHHATTNDRKKNAMSKEDKNKMNDRKRKIESSISDYISPQESYYKIMDTIKNSTNNKPPEEIAATFWTSYGNKLLSSNPIFNYLDFPSKENPNTRGTLFPESFSVYIGFMSTQLFLDGNIYNKAESLLESLLKGDENKSKCDKIEELYRIYSKEIFKALTTYAYISSSTSHEYISNEFMLNEILRYEFINSLNSDFFDYISSKIRIQPLMTLQHPQKTPSYDESIFYLSLLQLFMLYDIDLNKISKDWYNKCQEKKNNNASAILSIENLRQRIPNLMYANTHISLENTLRYMLFFLGFVEKDKGEFFSDLILKKDNSNDSSCTETTTDDIDINYIKTLMEAASDIVSEISGSPYINDPNNRILDKDFVANKINSINLNMQQYDSNQKMIILYLLHTAANYDRFY